VDALADLAALIVGFMDSGPPLWIALLYIAITGIPLTLLHELSHAVTAHHLIGGEVKVSVGSAGRLAQLRLGQIVLSLNALAQPGKSAGLAEFDATRATARDVLLIALAGPAASLVGAVATGWALASSSPSGVLHGLLWAATFGGLGAVVVNLIPFTFQEGRDGPGLPTDGRLALDALRVGRAIR
jgi:hypothetical protein